jgi:hypothetical protein
MLALPHALETDCKHSSQCKLHRNAMTHHTCVRYCIHESFECVLPSRHNVALFDVFIDGFVLVGGGW